MEKEPGIVFRKIWHVSKHAIGVLVRGKVSRKQEFSAMLYYVIILTLDYNEDTDTCEMEFAPITHDGNVFQGMSSNTLAAITIRRLLEFSEEHGWQYNVPKPQYRGTSCPFCEAIYVYYLSDIREDGTVSCQNCGKQIQVDYMDFLDYFSNSRNHSSK